MDEITVDELDGVDGDVSVRSDKAIVLSEEKLACLEKDLSLPVNAQKQLAAKVKLFLDAGITRELADKGYLSDYTRRWVHLYNSLLDSIQKSLFGDKSVSLHLHKVSHAHIASKIKEFASDEILDVEDFKGKK